MTFSPDGLVAVGGGLFVVGNVLVFWYREWRKHKTWARNGEALDEIKVCIDEVDKKVDKMDEKVGQTTVKMTEIGTTVKEQKQQCTKTVNRFDEAMRQQADQMLDLAKGK